MKNKASKIIFLILLTSLFSCKKSTNESIQSSAPINRPGTSSCSIGKWTEQTGPINLKMSSDFSSEFSNADLINGLNPIEQMAKAWNDAIAPSGAILKVPMEITSQSINGNLAALRDSEFGIYKSHTWFNNVSANALAITQFYGIVKSNEILGNYVDLTHADIIVNYRDFPSDFSMTGNPLFTYDLPTILLHEMGHFLGLCHETSTRDSVMAPYYAYTQRSPKSIDTTKIRSLYGPTSGQSAISIKAGQNKSAISQSVGTEVRGIIELNANGHCKHFLEGKLIFEHFEF